MCNVIAHSSFIVVMSLKVTKLDGIPVTRLTNSGDASFKSLHVFVVLLTLSRQMQGQSAVK